MSANRRGRKASKVMCIVLLMLVSIFASLAPSASAADWTKKDIGNIGGTVQAVATGDANNDGVDEVYAASSNGGAFMIKQNEKDPADWKVITLGYGEGASFFMMGIAVGDGRDSGKNATYAGGYDQNTWEGRMYEFYLKDGEWKKDQMGTGGWVIMDVDICDGDNDGRTEIYGSSYNGNIYEYTYSNGWNGRDIGYSSYYQPGVACGDADNDGKNEVYSVSGWWDYRHAYQYKYNSGTGTWSTTDLGQPPDLYSGYILNDIEVGDGDNDGKNEIYIPDYMNVYRVGYNQGSWTWSSIFSNGYSWHNRVAIGDGDANGKNEVYVTSDTDQVYKLVYSQGSWSSVSIGSANSDTAGVVVGNGDNFKNQLEVYAGSADSHVYQFMMDITPPPNPKVWSPTHTPDVWSNISNIVVMWRPPPDPSGIAGYSFEWSQVSNTVPDDKWDAKGGVDKTESGTLADGDSYYFHIRAEDGALNWNPEATHFGPLKIDTVAPANLGVKVNDDSSYTNNKIVKLAVSGDDARAGMGAMAFSNDGSKYPAFDNWEPWTSPRENWDLTDINWGGNDNDGVKTVYMKARDKAGNSAPAPVSDTIFLDRKLPVGLSIKINDGAEYANSASVTLGITAQDPDPASGLDQMRFSNDGTTWGNWEAWNALRNGWSLTADAGGNNDDGKKVVYFQVMDKAGNIAGPMSDDITLDRTAPGSMDIIINSGAEYTNITDVRLDVKALDPSPGTGLDKMQFSNDASTYSSWEDFTAVKNPWSLTIGAGGSNVDGLKAVYFQTKDKVANVGGPIKDTIFLDRAKPSNLKMSINDGATLTNSVKVMLNMSAEDPNPGSGIDVMRIAEQGQPWSDWMGWQSPYAFALTNGDGSKTVCFIVRDKAGNVAGPECDSIVLDTTPPTITNVRVMGITDTSAIITWSTDSPADSIVDYGTSVSYGSQKKDGAFVTEHSATLTGLTPTTVYHFRVASTDEVGNGPTVTGDFTFTTTATPDRVPPIITNLRVEGITDTLAVVLWETNEAADGWVKYGKTTDYGLVIGSDVDIQSHSFTILGLEPDTTYYIQVSSTDPSGNGPINATTQFKTMVAPDKTAPVISNVMTSGITDKLAVVTWTTNEVADGVVEFGTTPQYGKVLTDATFVKDHMMTLSGLSPATTYYFIVRSTDPSGNGPTTSAQYTFQTTMTPDLTPPAISNVRATGITNTMAVISWNTDELADGIVEYGTTNGYGTTATDLNFGIAHSITLVGLKASTTYHFRVLSKDMSGNGPSKSVDFSFTTAAVEDKEAPIITDVRVEGISSEVAVILWKTNEVADSYVEFGVTVDYGLFQRDEAFIADHSIAIKGLNASTIYHFRVKSKDVSGNGPSVSDDFIFTTKDIKDITPPLVSNVTINDVTQNSARINWMTNEPASTLVIFAKNGSAGAQAGDADHFVVNHGWVLSGLEPDTTYTVKVVSIDPSGNRGESSQMYTFKTKAKITPGPGPGPGPGPIGDQDNWWIWLLIGCLIIAVVGTVAGVWWYKTKKTPMMATAPARGAYGARGQGGRYAAPAGDEAYDVEEMQMDEGDVEDLAMDEGTEDLGDMAMDGEDGEVQTLDMGDEGGDMELGAAITAVTSAPAARPKVAPKKPVRTVKCPGCKEAIPIYSETQTDIKCPNCGKAGKIKPMKAAASAPVEEVDLEGASPLAGLLGSEPVLAPPPKPAPKAAPRQPTRPTQPAKAPARSAAPPPKVPLKTLTCSGCRGKVPIYTDKRPIRITCPSCGKGGTLKN